MTRLPSPHHRCLARRIAVATLTALVLWCPASATSSPGISPTPVTSSSVVPYPATVAAPSATPTPAPVTSPATPATPVTSPATPAAPATSPATPDASPSPAPKPRLKGTFDGRVMPEVYDYFTPSRAYKNAYAFVGVRARGTLEYDAIDWQALVQGQATIMLGLPSDSVAPAPARALGQGGTYYAIAVHQDLTTLGIRQGYVRVGRAGESGVQIGRLEYHDGTETTTGDPVLDWIKSNRMSQLIIGNPDYNNWGRGLEGLRADLDVAGVRLTGALIRPLQVDDHFATSVPNVTTAHAALTFKNGLVPRGEGQIFFNQCNDTRFVPELDNRTDLAGRTINALGGNKVSTVGVRYLARLGTDGDASAFVAHQGGKWGGQTQDAYAAIAELGVRFPKVPWQPWVRGGYRQFSGDSNPLDNTHGTWIADLANARQRFNMYTNANLREFFAQVLLTPSKTEGLRVDLRSFHLDRAADLWYAGNGVAQNRGINGFAGKPSGGATGLGTLIEATYENRIDAHNLLRVHFGQAFGGPVVRATFPAQTNGHLFYVEYHYLIP